MKPTLSFFAAGIPKGQPRTKAFRRGNHAGVYDPGTADGWKTIIRLEAKSNWDGVPFDGPLALVITIYFARPKSHFKKSGLKLDAPSHHTGRPDADNLAKAIMDALTNLGVWKDDSQVAALRIEKRYTELISGAQVSVARMVV